MKHVTPLETSGYVHVCSPTYRAVQKIIFPRLVERSGRQRRLPFVVLATGRRADLGCFGASSHHTEDQCCTQRRTEHVHHK